MGHYKSTVNEAELKHTKILKFRGENKENNANVIFESHIVTSHSVMLAKLEHNFCFLYNNVNTQLRSCWYEKIWVMSAKSGITSGVSHE